MYGDFAIIEVEIVMTVGLTMFHAKQSDIGVNTRFYVGCCYFKVDSYLILCYIIFCAEL